MADAQARALLAMPLPPPWRQEGEGDTAVFVNLATGECTKVHPFERYLAFGRQAEPEPQLTDHHAQHQQQNDYSTEGQVGVGGQEQDHHQDQNFSYFEDGRRLEEDGTYLQTDHHVHISDPEGPKRAKMNIQKDACYEYHCQWSERDVFGKVTLYGLTLRVSASEIEKTYIKFDGMDGQWEYVALKGPYGSLELHDLYIGGRITVFGRHLTISSANLAACQWIDRERKKLLKQQAEFRRKIESVGHVPVVRKIEVGAVKHITRDSKTMGQVNLRNLMKDNAKLGEQLAGLGMAARI